MIAIVSRKTTRLPSVITVGAISLLCIGLVACSGSTRVTPAPANGLQSPTATPVPIEDGASAVPLDIASGNGNGAPGPCALLTQAEAMAAVGKPLNAGVESVPLGSCAYNSSDFTSNVSFTVSTWESISNAARSGGVPPTSISGVGDEALNLNGSNGSNLYVRKGSAGFLLSISGPNIDSLPDHGLAKEETLVALMLPRL